MNDIDDLIIPELSLIELVRDIEADDGILILKGSVGTVLVSGPQDPMHVDAEFDLESGDVVCHAPARIVDPYPFVYLEKDKDFKVVSYFDEQEGRLVLADEYEERWKCMKQA